MSALELILNLSLGIPGNCREAFMLDGLRFLIGFLLAFWPLPKRDSSP